MYKYRGILAYCISLLIMGGVAGCHTGPSTIPIEQLPLSEPITVALPYVEAVHFPAGIHAGQPFVVIVDLSCDLNPIALRSPERPFPAADHWDGPDLHAAEGHTGYDYSATFKPFRDLTRASGSLPVQSSVTYSFDPLPAGVWKLYYLSAASREQGGMNVLYDKQAQDEMDNLQSYSKTMEFTVLQ